MAQGRVQAVISAPLIVALALSGCGAVRVRDHRHPSGSAVSVRVVWDDGGTSRLVAGVHVTLSRLGEARPARPAPPGPGRHLTATTNPYAALFFGELEPGTYLVTLSGPRLSTVDRTFELEPDRRVSVRVAVEALETLERPPRDRVVHEDLETSGASDGVLCVLKGVGLVLAAVTVVGIVLVVAALLDEDDDPCGPCRSHGRWRSDHDCRCTCHLD